MTTTTARQFIYGRLVGSKQESTSTSPADGSPLGRYSEPDEEQATEVVAAARTAFADTDWSRDRRLRHQVLNGIADTIERRTNELVNLLTRETANSWLRRVSNSALPRRNCATTPHLRSAKAVGPPRWRLVCT